MFVEARSIIGADGFSKVFEPAFLTARQTTFIADDEFAFVDTAFSKPSVPFFEGSAALLAHIVFVRAGEQ